MSIEQLRNYNKVRGMLGLPDDDIPTFIHAAVEYLSKRHSELYIEHIEGMGWKVSTSAFFGEIQSNGDGSLVGALTEAILNNETNKKSKD